MESSEDNFIDQYVNGLIKEEIKIEEQVFFDNKSPLEKLNYKVFADLTKDLAEAIDKEILCELIEMGKMKMDDHKISFDIMIRPRTGIEFIDISHTPS